VLPVQVRPQQPVHFACSLPPNHNQTSFAFSLAGLLKHAESTGYDYSSYSRPPGLAVELFDFQKLDAIKVKGKENEVQIYALSKCFCTAKVLEVYDLVISELLVNLSPNLFYHSISHTLDVFTSARKIAILEGVGESDLELVMVAALFHDTGFLVQADGHEEISCQYAKDHLFQIGFTLPEIEIICGMIRATKIPQQPQNKLEEIIADADLDYLGRDDFFTIGDQLFKELKARNVIKEESVWDQIQIKFIENHHYFTETARNVRAAQKEKHLQIIKSKYS
jgi:HD superfamily phosphodiesterase